MPSQIRMVVQDSPNPKGIMSSKASGEPCLMVSSGVLAALQNAVAAARAEVTGTEKVCGPHLCCGCVSRADWSLPCRHLNL